jgi:hypothetical protein
MAIRTAKEPDLGRRNFAPIKINALTGARPTGEVATEFFPIFLRISEPVPAGTSFARALPARLVQNSFRFFRHLASRYQRYQRYQSDLG